MRPQERDLQYPARGAMRIGQFLAPGSPAARRLLPPICGLSVDPEEPLRNLSGGGGAGTKRSLAESGFGDHCRTRDLKS